VNRVNQCEYLVLSKPAKDASQPPLVRLHSECVTGDVFGSARCDCGAQLDLALQHIANEGGWLLYLPQEGRGIGLANKIKAYALQDDGLDTVAANLHLGFPADARDYGYAAQILRSLQVSTLRLLTNNPAKRMGLEQYGIAVADCVKLHTVPTPENEAYLAAKREKLGHLL
jgi:3,4-dihydroxy 2-butanone 4-phosphate synthase / GTP cyclohydrolase II